MKTNEVKAAAMELPDPERAALARELIDSLDQRGADLSDVEWAEAWGREIAQRLEAFEQASEASSHVDVMARARARLVARRG